MSVLSPGPIFFKQERVGFMGRRFRLFKFRTMRVDAETSGHQSHLSSLMATNAPMQKLDALGDARLIPGGWLIRAMGLDELPQIINVFRGEMSIVGPRPCIPYEFENYNAAQRRRFRSVPGLTGLWQVSGKNQTSFGRMIQLDVYYSAKKSLWLDLRILLMTLPAVARQVAEMCAARKTP
jgi:lipopolysaccharide/colanic/teichoic acid biosynthesis glycosyltransferase